jgi:hypothetical protein
MFGAAIHPKAMPFPASSWKKFIGKLRDAFKIPTTC